MAFLRSWRIRCFRQWPTRTARRIHHGAFFLAKSAQETAESAEKTPIRLANRRNDFTKAPLQKPTDLSNINISGANIPPTIKTRHLSINHTLTRNQHAAVQQSPLPKMSALNSERHIYPTNPHTKTVEEVDRITGNFYPAFTYKTPQDIARIYTVPIENTHPIVPRWGEVCKQIMDELEKSEINWTAIECFRRRQHEPRAGDVVDDATIVITAREVPPMTDDLTATLHAIHTLSGMFNSHIAV